MANYNNLMKEELLNLKGNKLLLHACCGPCSSFVIERLTDYFDIDIFYYNPNITDENEYYKRLDEVKRLVSLINHKNKLNVIDAGFSNNLFFELSKGLENEPERGKRCYKCYKERLEKSCIYAKENGYDYFATTLTLSPYKNSNWVNEIGENLNKKYDVNYLYSDFKKENGYKRSIELSKIYNLYRQDYCGCIYSLRDKKSIEKNTFKV